MKYLRMYAVFMTLSVWAMPVSADILSGQQVPTPFTLKAGQLNFKLQGQHNRLGSEFLAGGEYGINDRFSVALTQGINPGEFFAGIHAGLFEKGPFQLSMGTRYSTTTRKVDVYGVAGATVALRVNLFGGIIKSENQDVQGMIGAVVPLSHSADLRADHITGRGNYTSIALDIKPALYLTISPAIYVSNNGGGVYPKLGMMYRWH